ncbi:hypothetical protein [Streptomyces sp. NBC_00120]|uniref:hypothetical protein n=1 Tax=Streptomyces sp. NBC_00120 TaxID=2975660 RepID=UPI0022529622|nr:hypothetical protein [Streptomyces sp. NBC_00120]MCX5321311.1 hypothetical protein [Streptomyces sp. NBC_00120]
MTAVSDHARPPLLVALPAGPEPLSFEGGGPGTLLRTLLRDGPSARTELVARTRLSPAAVSRHTAELIGLGLLRELPPRVGPPRVGRPRVGRPRVGRPQVPMDIDPGHHLACGVHIALDHMTFAMVDLRGQVTAQRRLPHPGGPRQVLEEIGRHLPGFLSRHAVGRSVLGLGVVTGGWQRLS